MGTCRRRDWRVSVDGPVLTRVQVANDYRTVVASGAGFIAGERKSLRLGLSASSRTARSPLASQSGLCAAVRRAVREGQLQVGLEVFTVRAEVEAFGVDGEAQRELGGSCEGAVRGQRNDGGAQWIGEDRMPGPGVHSKGGGGAPKAM